MNLCTELQILDVGCLPLQQVNKVTRLEAEEATPYVGEALRALRAEVGNQAAVLGCAHISYRAPLACELITTFGEETLDAHARTWVLLVEHWLCERTKTILKERWKNTER